MSESNNNTPMRITQLEEATAYEDGMYYAVAKAGSGTKKIDSNIPNGSTDKISNFAYIKGNGNAYVDGVICIKDKIESGCLYRLNISKWLVDGIPQSSSAYLAKFGYYNGETVTYVKSYSTDQTLPDHVDIYIPESVSEPALYIGGRVQNNTIAIINIVNTKYNNELNWLVDYNNIYSMIGLGNSYSSKDTSFDLIPNSYYRVYIVGWNTSEVTTGGIPVFLDIGYKISGTKTTLVTYYKNDVIPEYIDIYIPDTAENAVLTIGGRVNANDFGVIAIQNINDNINNEHLQKTKDIIVAKSKGNNVYTESVYSGKIQAGHVYKLDLSYWDKETVPTTGYGVLFECGWIENNVKTTFRKIYVFDNLDPYYLLYVPENVTDPILWIGGRVSEGKFGYVIVEDITNFTLPQYAETRIDSMNNSLRQQQTSDSFSFAFLTDIHINGNTKQDTTSFAMEVSKKAINKINDKSPLDLCVFNGDYLNNGQSTTKQTALSWYNELVEDLSDLKIKQWRGMGNHDFNDINTTTGEQLSLENFYQYFSKYASLNDFSFGNIKKDYAFIDIDRIKTRIIFINTVDIPNGYQIQHVKGVSNEQLEFLANALSFTEQGWAVIFISHHMLQNNSTLNPNDSDDAYITPEHGGVPLIGIINAFINKTTYSYESSIEDWEYNINVDFSRNASSEVIAMFSGHTHRDAMTNSLGYVMMSTTAAGASVAAVDSEGTSIHREPFSISETSWDIITIDRNLKTIYALRYGAGENRTIIYG